MTKNILTKFLTAMLLATSVVIAQDEQDVDAIEKARQAKEAAEKAAAEASAATEAAIEAAAQKAAKEAREEAKRKKEEEEARKLAEAQAAEEAELDAAATAAAEEAKRYPMVVPVGVSITTPYGFNFSALGYSFNVVFCRSSKWKSWFDQDMKPVIAAVGLK